MYVITMRPAPVRKFAAQQSFHSSHNRFSSRSALLALLFVCISTLAITGCGGVVALSSSAASQSASTSNLVATPAAVDFGNVSLGSSATQKISLANKGSASAQISQLALSNTAFRVEGLGTLPVTVAAGSTLSLTVHFSPTSSSDSYDQLNVITSSSSSAAAKVNLHGKGESGSAEISGLTCDEAKFSGAGSDSCTIVTNMAARSGGVQVHLSSNNSAIKVPARVKVPEGASKVKFAATVSKVSSDEIGIITAKQGDDVRSFSISLSPGSGTVGTPELTLLSCDPTSFTGEGKAVCKASLSSATAKPLSVALASTNSAVSIPASATIAAGATAASFTASVSAVVNPQTATISATANGTSRTLVIQLGASKKSAGALTLSASSLQFGDVALGTATTKSLTITSSGNAPVNVKSDSVTGKGFSVSGGNFPDSLKPGQALVLTVHFNPSVAGATAGQMTISSSAGDQTVSLSGNGTTATPTLSALSCSSSSVVGALADSCKVTLSGSAPKGGINVALASSSTSVQVPKSITIPATANTATFTANAAAVSTSQSVRLTATEGSASKSISLQLSPASAQLSADATTVSFGSVSLNQSTTQIVTLTSVGKAPVTVKSVSITGTGFSSSPVSLPATLNPGQTLALTLVYKASTAGSQTGQLIVNSDSSTNSTLTIALNANATGHRVELSWNPPADSSNPVASYRIYRATGSNGSFSKIGSSGQPSYTDTNVQSGTTYNYYVTSVNSAGGESKASNTFTATIP